MLTGLFLAAVDKQFAWYVARAGGLVAWAVVTASIVWGLALSTRLVSKRGAPAWLLDLHRYLGTLSLVFTAIHVAALPFENVAHISIAELFVPFRSAARPGYNPVNAAWGIVALYLVVAIQLTSWMKKRLSRRVWHAIHLLSIPLFVAGTVHGFRAGTDVNNRFILWSSIVGGVVMIFLLLFRIFSKIGDPPERVPVKASPGSTPTPTSTSTATSTAGVTSPEVSDLAEPAKKSRIPESALRARSERAAGVSDLVEPTKKSRIPESALRARSERAATALIAAESDSQTDPQGS
jgi:hypothetical protein